MKRPEHRPFKVLTSEYLIQRPWCTIRRERVELPTGAIVPEWYIMEFPDWVNVIAITTSGEFVMISQYRHALARLAMSLLRGVATRVKRPSRAHVVSCWRRRVMAVACGASSSSRRPTPPTTTTPSIHFWPRA